jgi:xylose isomerase
MKHKTPATEPLPAATASAIGSNRYAVITGFYGRQGNRFLEYQPQRPVRDKLAMIARTSGCAGAELCYPDDFADLPLLRSLLADLGIGVSALNFRSRRPGQWMRGSWTSESAAERQAVVDDARRLMDLAAELGVKRVTNCPLNDGSDGVFEIDYSRALDYAAETYAAVAAHNRDVRLCIEYKPNEPRVRSLFDTAGATLAFIQMVGAGNLGVTLDMGHALAAGERPAQVAALLARAGKLFYIQLNDNDGAFDWDLPPGMFRFWETIEFLHVLPSLGYRDDWFSFDIVPKEHDPVTVYGRAFAMTRKIEAIAERIDADRLAELTRARDPTATMSYLFSLL